MTSPRPEVRIIKITREWNVESSAGSRSEAKKHNVKEKHPGPKTGVFSVRRFVRAPWLEEVTRDIRNELGGAAGAVV
ncbi:hypothetical protein J2S90_002020 [Arthrobacter bambusae]|uniref:Uncharacterized protein n=1 Tax=Arthrobacter bambusae TaxID=1338426 RepID=A0AAW8DGN4_9MICC|nr:hypothetical protein [Arthrobacter bambusae]MDQ0129877.1 hypothetical protein [Arthrobacter bambusae]MDQ0181257.1 hypothetical protein [Arthrobacter bambusae]